MRKKLSILLIGIIAFVMLLSGRTLAAKGSFSVSKSSVSLTEGGNTTFNITTSNCEGQFTISSSDSSVVKVNKGQEWVSSSETITLTAGKAGTATITITAQDVGDTDENVVSGSKKISVTVKDKTTSSGNNNSNSNNNSSNGGTNTTTKAPSFTSVNETVYAKSQVNVRESYSTSSKVLGTLKTGDSVKRIGKSSEWSKVTYNGKTAYISSSFLTTTKPNEEKSNNTNLKSLTVTPTGLTPDFMDTITEYTMSVGANVDNIKVDAVVADEKAKVEVSGNDNLKIGTNTITIKVTAEDGKTKTYKIVVTKEKQEQLKLKELLIEGLPLEPEFDSDVYEYTLTLDRNDISQLNITAIPNRENANIEILGNAELKVGTNMLTILVKSEDGKDTTTYQVTVTIPEQSAVATSASPVEDMELYKSIALGVGVSLIIIMVIVVIAKHRKKDDVYDYGEEIEEPDEEIEEIKPIKPKKIESEFRLEDLPRLRDEEVPNSLRKKKKPIEESESKNNAENQVEEETERAERNKKLDELYNIDDEELAPKGKRGKHF